MIEHVVRAGECLASIAARHKTTWKALWDANPELREKRRDPGILYPGDIVQIPDKEEKWLPVQPGLHVLVVEGGSSPVRVQFVRPDDSPRAETPVRLVIDGAEQTQTTDAEGFVTFRVPARAAEGHVYIGTDTEGVAVSFGDLDPADTPRGAQARLRHLGFYHRAIDGDAGPWTKQALRAFQLRRGLDPTGELDEATVQELLEYYGS